MKHYLQLQHKMINRHLREFGVNPIIGYVLILLVFLGLSIYLYYKTEYAAYIYVFFGTSSLMKLSETNRNEFLKSCFSNKRYYEIRVLENAIVILPFLIFLSYQFQFLFVIVLLLIAIVLAFTNFSNQFQYTIPTPFFKQPFEFIVGFRKSFFMFFMAYFLGVMAITVGNFNLGIFALLVVCLTCLNFYSNLEGEYYIWIFACSAKQFLFQKIITAILFSSLLYMPIVVALTYFFPENVYIIFGVILLSYFYISAIILAKYSSYPREMSLPQGFFLAGCVLFPPFLLGVIPYFYFKSIQQLNPILA